MFFVSIQRLNGCCSKQLSKIDLLIYYNLQRINNSLKPMAKITL